MTFPWPQVLFIAITFVTLPLYILILIVVCKQPELSTFYVLIVSEGIADIYAVVSYFLATALRFTLWLDELYWGHERFFANYAYLSVYFSTYVRSVGITLIAFQRYVIICLRGKPLGKVRLSFSLFAVGDISPFPMHGNFQEFTQCLRWIYWWDELLYTIR
ncbi:unnamed protein product [Haemonchus placei]|uniref:G_PROTEIN_RECEP_F1_2 domain-containing protein n=1 Tax=Haemonchus placei TaxID=6290 RepID=A0A0N4WPW0_HAEPC|nr:unnamed protein product [Haemonchus placei]